MLMPQTVEYAFRAMACLALSSPQARTVEDMAGYIEVPRPYLSRVMRRLVVAGLVSSQRGVHGGYRLKRSPEEIFYVDILVAMDFRPESNHCAFGLPRCDASKPCPLHNSWMELQSGFRDWAVTHTLASLMADDRSRRCP
jgi:Rrf2 family iron-sulfur cluster assembly transcriptional regulator